MPDFLGGTSGKIGLNVEKWSFSEGLMGLLGLCFKFYYAPYPVIIEITLWKISFSKLMPIQSYQGKTIEGVDLTPPPPWYKKGQVEFFMQVICVKVGH